MPMPVYMSLGASLPQAYGITCWEGALLQGYCDSDWRGDFDLLLSQAYHR